MRGTVAKRLRKFVKEDNPDLPLVVYTKVLRGQEYKMMHGIEPSKTVIVKSECLRYNYLQLKYIWKNVS